MADTPAKANIAQTAKAIAAGLSLPTLAAALPQPEATWVLYACAAFASAGFAATLIPLPANQSGKLWLVYRIINFLAFNWKYAANAAVMMRGAISTKTEPPKAGPGSVVQIQQDNK
ncbi:hypothetical protein CSR02_00730 [Acetobacter pomorum]|uniref:Uncharacterized protein n=1 Tax=Acetobacter pomorum TaxID=65959 RepID=A0A2G4RG59_9PROT|nr:hypothetical protein [Acetobacter pomorum]PHY95556.1 hypothetical protein CSR02_00730 [Acetobacter pomorum]GBR47278.1 hypothetical protein AA11825_0616 [Acetobacter pomorum DSM 11825]